MLNEKLDHRKTTTFERREQVRGSSLGNKLCNLQGL